MTANLKSVDIANGKGVYDIVADDGTVLQSGITVGGTITDATTVAQMKTFVTNNLTASKAFYKGKWDGNQNLTQLNAMALAWDENVV